MVTFYFLARTNRGTTIVVEEVLRRLPINGELRADGARSDRLLEGVRLYAVTMQEKDERAFLQADSAQLRYRWSTLVSGALVLDTLELWGARVELSRHPGEHEFNVQRLFAVGEGTDSARAYRSVLAFHQVAIHDGELRVLRPVARGPADGQTTPSAPDTDSLLVEHTITDIAALLPSVVLRSPDAVGQLVEIDHLALVIELSEDSLRLRDLRGRMRHAGGRLDLDLEYAAWGQSEASGSAFVEFPPQDEPEHFGLDLRLSRVDLSDLHWLDARLPAGQATGRVAVDAQGERRRVTLTGLDVESGRSLLRLDGSATLTGDRLAFEDLDVAASPLALTLVEPWLGRTLPVRGSIEGSAALHGTPDELVTRARLTLHRSDPDQAPITADLDGTLHVGEELGFTGLRATLDPFDFDLLGELAGGMDLAGPGRVSLTATGRASDAILFTAALQHQPADLPASTVLARGTVGQRGGRWVLDVQADVAPLSLTALRGAHPELPLSSEVYRSLRARGPLSDLTLTTDLTTEAGRLAMTARFDASDPGAHYEVEGRVGEFVLSRLMPDIPDPTVLTGHVELEGRGTDPATLTLDARARLSPSRVGGLHFDTAAVVLRVREGLLHVDTLDGVVGGIDVQGRGTLAMEEDGPAGRVTIGFRGDSLERLRPLVLGDAVIARDTLTVLDRELLLAEGIDPDTLPTAAEVAGTVVGEVTLSGSIDNLTSVGTATFGRLRWGEHAVRGAAVSFRSTRLSGEEGRLAVNLEADSVAVLGREFTRADVELEYSRPGGSLALMLECHQREEYRARARFEVQEGAVVVELEQLTLRFDTLTWALARQAVVAWNEQGLSIRNLMLKGPGDSLRIEADGLLPRQGPADFRVQVEGLPLDRMATLLQREELGLTGRMSLSATVGGRASAPVIVGTISATDLGSQTIALTRLTGELAYADRTLRLDVAAWSDSLQVLNAKGQVPVDLAFREGIRRVPTDREMDLNVVAESLPALALGYLGTLDDVVGTISGEFHISGTIDDPSPTGTMALREAGWTLTALGVRHEGVGGRLTLHPDGTVEMNAAGRAGWTITTTGTVRLQPLTDPTFDLQIAMDNFQAVRRLDVAGSVSGLLTLTGTYSRPVVRSPAGRPVRVVEGVLYVDEFQRTAGVVDLADPAFFAVVDTSVVNPRVLLGATANPFLRNLRVDVDLAAERNSWLRSESR